MLSAINDVDIKDIIQKYRSKAFQEINLSKPSRPKIRRKDLTLDMILHSIRREWFSKVSSDDVDYVYAFRLLRFSMEWFGRTIPYITSREAGYRLGLRLVEHGIVKDLDDMVNVFISKRIGLLDLIKESVNYMRVHIYECITCSGIPNIGMCVCDFEAGALSGLLEKLIGRNIVRERYCWGRGYSFCGFDIYFI